MNPIGIYEKALPDKMNWHEKLEQAKEIGFDFVEMSIDEQDERLARLDWSKEERQDFVYSLKKTKMRVPSICLSGHRRFPLGSNHANVRNKALDIMKKAIDLADDIGVRVIQLAGYDVYYEERNEQTRSYFIENLRKSCEWAAEKQITLAIEIMDDPFINSISKYLEISEKINSPWLYVYPDLGNISAWANDVPQELKKGRNHIAGIHLKDTIPVTGNQKGKFKEVPFGEGCVNFVASMKALREINYTGPFLIEMWSGKSESYVSEINSAIDYLKPLLKKGGYNYDQKFKSNKGISFSS
ncbi:L-ribulose-5-phosphate 3-epimerase [Virgibacillus necropolis]|uniref:L-ribulose-5-phosphate 3-epimerase n=1 Tax=Virgibacillus necropolis TaxID=163877 RepID=A0A221MGH9_9BACI|nr:L-ribulose-5-phosphate 3-epimerase [Virgibacillus necropolis]ASN06699.1 xylulose 5-phosphate 3-epimerase [Virgibacillus necropolis]